MTRTHTSRPTLAHDLFHEVIDRQLMAAAMKGG
jgi:hypothetical protein